MKKFVIAFLKLQAKLVKRIRIVDVFGTFADAQSMLIFMPDILEDFGIARKFIRTLTDSFSTAKLHFVMRSSFKSLLDGNLNYGTIFVADRDENYMGLPKKDLKQRILATKFDIAIDLNNDFHLLVETPGRGERPIGTGARRGRDIATSAASGWPVDGWSGRERLPG